MLMEDSTVLRLFMVNGPECLLFSGAAQDLKRTISACLPLNRLLNHSFFLGDFQSSRFSCSWLNLLWRTVRFSALIKLTYSCLPRVAHRSARLRVLRLRVPRLGVPRLGVPRLGVPRLGVPRLGVLACGFSPIGGFKLRDRSSHLSKLLL